jgi:hypothetical protein
MSNTEVSGIFESVDTFELDDAAEITVVMSRDELNALLSIDDAWAGRATIHERPTRTMSAVKVA